MPITDQVGVRTLDTPDDLDETRLGAVGYVFHGNLLVEGAKKAAAKAGTNLLHFARCAKLDKAGDAERRSGSGRSASPSSTWTRRSAPTAGSGARSASGRSLRRSSTSA